MGDVPNRGDLPKKRGIGASVVILIAGVAMGVICYGPFFGVILSAALVLPVALIVHVLWNRALRAGYFARARTRGILLAGAALATAVGGYLLLRPPTGAELIKKHLGLSRREFSAVQTWSDTWGLDPLYAVKFRIDGGVLEQAASHAGFVVAAEPPDRLMFIWHPHRGLPTWWTPERISDARSWSVETGNPVLRVRFDQRTGEAYLLVMYF